MTRHKFQLPYLIAGMFFAGIATIAITGPHDEWPLVEWIVPAVFLLGGTAILGSAIAQARREPKREA